MLLDQQQDLDLQPRRTKTLLISVGVHLLLIAVIALNPDFLTSTPKRIIRIAGQDHDLSKNQLTELIVPPDLRPKPRPRVEDKPLIQPPPQPNVQPAPPAPPPPP